MSPRAGETVKTVLVEPGATIIATGGQEDKPDLYHYGRHPNVLTHLNMDRALDEKGNRVSGARSIVFIPCLGSRDESHPYCSKICYTHSLKSAWKSSNPKKKFSSPWKRAPISGQWRWRG
ncbi:MAG: hypothetical protein ACLFS7_10800 [Desulfosudaceae bacterium]